jgi:hypothetical protein
LGTEPPTRDIAPERDITAGEIALAGLEDWLEIIPCRIQPGILEATE